MWNRVLFATQSSALRLITCQTWSAKHATIAFTQVACTNGSKAQAKANVSYVSNLGQELRCNAKNVHCHFQCSTMSILKALIHVDEMWVWMYLMLTERMGSVVDAVWSAPDSLKAE